MMNIKFIALSLSFLSLISCKTNTEKQTFQSKKVFESPDLIITQITENTFQHTSFLNTESFGKVPCNGLIVKSDNEVVIYDTPTTEKKSEELIQWINKHLKSKINAVVATHFHEDCVGGLQAFDKNNIPSIATFETIKLAKEHHFQTPKIGFKNDTIIKVGHLKTEAKYFGEGHTKDNIVGYFPSEKVLFGGCLIKEINATKGYLGDANEKAWSQTVTKVKEEYPDVKVIIPGHGEIGDQKLLDYTIALFKP